MSRGVWSPHVVRGMVVGLLAEQHGLSGVDVAQVDHVGDGLVVFLPGHLMASVAALALIPVICGERKTAIDTFLFRF